MTAQPAFDFDGATYVASLDKVRLNAQLKRVVRAMRDGRWRTLAEIERITGDGQASVSARLRDLRKEKFGASKLDRRRRGEEQRGLHEYRIEVSAVTARAMEDA